MSDVLKVLVIIVGFLFAVLLLCFTGYNTWSLLNTVTDSPLVATLGLVVFEGGMLYWWMYFQKRAEGLGQMALSFGMFMVDLLFVCTATALHLGAVDANTFGPNTAPTLITAAVIMNITTELLMPFLGPETVLAIKAKSQEGKIMDKAFKMLETKSDNMAEDLANNISEDMMRELERSVLAGRKRGEVIEGSAYHVDRSGGRPQLPPPPPPEPEDDKSVLDRMRQALKRDTPTPNGRPIQAEQTSPAGPEDEDLIEVDAERYVVTIHQTDGFVGSFEQEGNLEWLENRVMPRHTRSAAPGTRFVITDVSDPARPRVVRDYTIPETPETARPTTGGNGRS